MSFCNDCETNWFLGKAGNCASEEEEICFCNDTNFNGVDSWFDVKDCSVNLSLRKNYHIGIFSLGILASIIALIATYKTRKLYKLTKKGSKRNSTNRINRITRTDRDMFLICLLLFLSFSTGSSYDLYFILNPKVLREHNVEAPQPIILGFTTFFSALAGYSAILAWFHNLPDPETFGTLLGLSTLITKCPNLVYKIVLVGFVLSILGFLNLAIILPLDPLDLEPIDYLEFGRVFDGLASIIVIGFTFFYGLNLDRLLQKMLNYEKTLDRSDNAANTDGAVFSHRNSLKVSIQRSIVLTRALLLVIVIYVSCIFIFVAFQASLERYYFFFQGLRFIAYYLLGTVFLTIVICRTNSGINPLKVGNKVNT